MSRSKDLLTPERLGWAMTAAGVFLLFTVVVDLLRGEGFATASAACALIVLPEGLRKLAEARRRPRPADRLGTATRVGILLAGVVVWSRLVLDWVQGRGTDWLLLTAGVVCAAAAALAAAGLVAGRQSERSGTPEGKRSGTSERMSA
ncbi:hypothetical protein GL263_18160 [Streptomyces durbertensis]|uniref:Integral membrane protein n=1 Tax=Streptomyces durbertensis TaxID=2448886 RepID=A0ABR6EJI2_9ACTN|nr:hypothetical protein [Streptomyces durbertensis]MBB1245472.1 hypothetical protein [Streptomyces durbertensis]